MMAAVHTRESLLVTGSIALGAVRELVRQREGELLRQFPSFLVVLFAIYKHYKRHE